MPHLIFPLKTPELLVDVRVNHNAPVLAAIRSAGLAAPASIPARASIDTGSNVTVVSNTILSKLGVPPYAQAQTQSIGGSLHVQLYRVSISILDESDPHSPRYIQPDLVIMEMPSLLNVDVLLGMDVIMGCRMLVDGPAQQLILEF